MLKGTIAECPACHGQDLDQLLSGFAVSSEGIRQASAKAARRAAAPAPISGNRKSPTRNTCKKHAEE